MCVCVHEQVHRCACLCGGQSSVPNIFLNCSPCVFSYWWWWCGESMCTGATVDTQSQRTFLVSSLSISSGTVWLPQQALCLPRCLTSPDLIILRLSWPVSFALRAWACKCALLWLVYCLQGCWGSKLRSSWINSRNCQLSRLSAPVFYLKQATPSI